MSVAFQNGIDYLVESCTDLPDDILIGFGNPIDASQTFTIIIGGTATMGDDYELTIPNTVTFETGTEIFTFPINVLVDNITEGTETVEISLARDFGCGQTIVSTVVVELHDLLVVDVLNDIQDTTILCVDNGSIQLEVTGAQEYQWLPDTLFDDPTSSMPIISTDSSQWVYVIGSLGVCDDIDSIYINAIDVEVNILPDVDNIDLCEGDSVVLIANNNVNDQNIVWNSFFNNFNDPSAPIQVITNESGFNFDNAGVTIDIGGCTAFDNININWVAFDVPQLANDTLICQNSSVQLAEEIASFTTTYSWTPNEFLEPSNEVSGAIATPEETTTYTLISMAGEGDNICADTSSITITVLPADVNIEPIDTVYICVGETATLTNTTTNNVIDLTWTPDNDLTLLSPNEVEVNPLVSQYYYAVLETPDCIVMDSVWVQVDSIPDLSIMADPEKDTYCEGEEVYLISPTYEPANFPTIDPNWIPSQPGAQTPDSFLNMVIIALEDFTYTRTTTVNACESTDTIFIEVTPVTSISVIPSDTTVCQGEQVQFSIDGPAILTDFTWMPPDGLSCTECREPVATATGSITYQVEAEFEGCPVGAAATINVPSQFFQYTGPNPICPGTTITLNDFNVPGATYTWTSSDGSLTSNEPQPMVSPTQTTTYDLVANIGSCSFTTSLTIEVLTNFTLSIEMNPADVLCPEGDVTLTAVVMPDQPMVFGWVNLTDPTQAGAGPSISLKPEETTTWQLTASTPDGCFVNVVEQTIEVAPFFTISVDPPEDDVLAGAASTFTAMATVAGIDFVWEESVGMLSTDVVVGTGASITVTNCETQEYLVTGTDFNGCEQTAFATQNVQGAFNADSLLVLSETGDTLFADSSKIYEGEQVELVVNVNPGGPGYSYTWLIAGIVVAETSGPSSGLIYLPEVGTDFINAPFTVMVTSPDGCTDDTEIPFSIFDNPVELPNVFTPNGDQTNDVLALVSIRPVDVLEFRVWNRWGDLVYENADGTGAWDGMIDGKAAASDVYIYSVVYQIPGSENPMSPLKGDVTLLR